MPDTRESTIVLKKAIKLKVLGHDANKLQLPTTLQAERKNLFTMLSKSMDLDLLDTTEETHSTAEAASAEMVLQPTQ